MSTDRVLEDAHQTIDDPRQRRAILVAAADFDEVNRIVAALPGQTPAWRLHTHVVEDGAVVAVVERGRGGATAVADADLSVLVSGSHEDLDTTLARFRAGERTPRP